MPTKPNVSHKPNAQHTPTPWKAEWDEERGTWRIWFKDGDFKDRSWSPTTHTIRFQPDIDFIVRAVNAHEELLEAAKAVAKHFPYSGNITVADADRLQAAIAKAEGRK